MAQLGAVQGQLGDLGRTAVSYDDDSRSTLTLAGANGTLLANVAAGTRNGEAINVEQFRSLAATIGGGISMGADGMIGMPNFNVQGRSYFNVGDAMGALDGALTGALDNIDALDQRVTGLEKAAPGPKPPHGAMAGADARTAADGSTAVAASATVRSATVIRAAVQDPGSPVDQAATAAGGSGGDGPRVAQLAAGSAGTDAVNKDQLDEVTQTAIEEAKGYADTADATTLHRANAYTDSKLADVVNHGEFDAFRNQVNDQFHTVNTRLDRVGAMGAAMSQMAFSTQGINSANRLGVGVGGYNGQAALSVGYSRAVGNRANLTFGAAVSGNEASGGVGFGIGW